MTMSRKLWTTVGFVWVALTVLTTLNAWTERQEMLAARQQALAEQVQSAIGIATHFQKAAAAGKLSVDEAKREAIATLRDFCVCLCTDLSRWHPTGRCLLDSNHALTPQKIDEMPERSPIVNA